MVVKIRVGRPDPIPRVAERQRVDLGSRRQVEARLAAALRVVPHPPPPVVGLEVQVHSENGINLLLK